MNMKYYQMPFESQSLKTYLVFSTHSKPHFEKDDTEMSYRPISFTSHVGNLLVNIILSRLACYCEKNIIIPVNQAGFRKGHYTIDHLVKLTTHVQKQVAMKKSTLTTCFDVREAYQISI